MVRAPYPYHLTISSQLHDAIADLLLGYFPQVHSSSKEGIPLLYPLPKSSANEKQPTYRVCVSVQLHGKEKVLRGTARRRAAIRCPVRRGTNGCQVALSCLTSATHPGKKGDPTSPCTRLTCFSRTREDCEVVRDGSDGSRGDARIDGPKRKPNEKTKGASKPKATIVKGSYKGNAESVTGVWFCFMPLWLPLSCLPGVGKPVTCYLGRQTTAVGQLIPSARVASYDFLPIPPLGHESLFLIRPC